MENGRDDRLLKWVVTAAPVTNMEPVTFGTGSLKSLKIFPKFSQNEQPVSRYRDRNIDHVMEYGVDTHHVCVVGEVCLLDEGEVLLAEPPLQL